MSFATRWCNRLRASCCATAAAVALVVLSATALPARAGTFDNTTPRGTFAGTHNYTVIGGTLRAAGNESNACSLIGGGNGSTGTSTAAVSGIPAGSTIMKAYLYWGGSGPTIDSQVTFGRTGSTSSITADQTFTENFVLAGSYDLAFFGGFKDVTSQVTGNGNYTFGGLQVAYQDNIGNSQGDYCTSQTVLSAWALIVVYSNPSERYRFTRVYDGLKYFRGSSVTTTQSGFRVPDLVDGKVTVVTWEGDPDTTTSTVLDGFNETLSFEGQPLFNTGCDLANNLYNSTLKAPGGTCNSNNYGADVDTYDVTPFLYEGQTGATLDYSSGNDLVLLTAQVISTTNTPVADLGISKVHNGTSFTAGQNGSYNIVVHNYGPEIATGTATVTDTLPAGLTFVSGTGTGWTCSAVGQAVTCNNSAPSLAVNADLPTLVLTVAVDGNAAASTQNTATVTHPMFDGTGGNQTATDTVTVKRSNLSTSTKTVVDLDGGDLLPGDTLRYTITLKDTGTDGLTASNVTVVDDLDANLGNLVMVSIPAGATDNSIGSGGANGTGQINVTGITVPAGQTRTIVYDVSVSGDAVTGNAINNTATIGNPNGPGATPVAPTMTVNVPDPAPPASGSKVLYVYDNQLAAPNPRQVLVRTPQTTNTSGTNYIIVPGSNNRSWPLTSTVPAGQSLVIPAQTIPVVLLTRAGNNSTGTNRPTTVSLLNGNTVIATSTSQNISGNTTTARTFNVNVPATTINAGSGLNLRVNVTSGNANREVWVYARTGTTTYSRLSFTTSTVINVDSVALYSAAYPSTATKTGWQAGNVVYVRADVSDPFGGYDVSGARLTLRDDTNAIVVNNAVMTAKTSPIYSDGTPNRIYEYAYTLPASPNYGTYTAVVTATEGSEGTITHTRTEPLSLLPSTLNVVKSHSGDFIAGANNSYTLLVSNPGASAVGGTTTVKDTLAAGLTFVSGTGTGWTCGAVGQLVTCTSTASVPGSGSMAPITLTVAVAGSMGSSVDNQASVGNSTIAAGFQKAGNTDTAIIRHPDLSTSTKAVSDLNGGDANPGDTLRYTITVKESAGYAANNVTVSDPLPVGLTGLTGLNTGLSTCSGSAGVAGGTLTVTGLALAGGATCTLVFDVQVSGSAGAGLVIDNTATISNPAGPGAAPVASITVSQSQVAAAGNKILYVYANDTMTRVAQSSAASNTTSSGANVYHDFVLAGVGGNLNIAARSTINIDLWLARNGSTTTTNRNVYVKLYKRVGVTDTQIGPPSNTVTFNSTTLAKQSFTITAPSFGTAGNLAPGDKLVLRIYNDSDTGGNDRSILFQQFNAGSGSTVTISTPTVVHVDGVAIYSAAYPATNTATSYGQGDTLYVRATVSDPFGFDDISGGSVVIKNPSGTTVTTATLVNGTHTKSTSGAIRVYEYAYTIPAAPPTGNWTATVTANEGSEGTINHAANGTFAVGGRVTLRKTWGAGATAGHAVTLAISGGTGAVAGSSTAPSTLTPATSNASTGATITLTEAYTNGVAGMYTTTLACAKDSDGTTVTPTGTGLSRTITMPAGSVTCTYTNSMTVPLTVVKVATTISDPVNGTTRPKAIPGAIVEYQIVVTNPAGNPIDANTVFINDQVPTFMDLRVADIGVGGSGPVQYVDGSPASGLTYSFVSLSSATDDVAFSNDGGATWTYTPTAGANGTDPAVTNIRINPKGVFNANNAQFTIRLRMRVE